MANQDHNTGKAEPATPRGTQDARGLPTGASTTNVPAQPVEAGDMPASPVTVSPVADASERLSPTLQAHLPERHLPSTLGKKPQNGR
jgi:hypothetical protein